jgi:hypothetical protein
MRSTRRPMPSTRTKKPRRSGKRSGSFRRHGGTGCRSHRSGRGRRRLRCPRGPIAPGLLAYPRKLPRRPVAVASELGHFRTLNQISTCGAACAYWLHKFANVPQAGRQLEPRNVRKPVPSVNWPVSAIPCNFSRAMALAGLGRRLHLRPIEMSKCRESAGVDHERS